ncbi:hypothetical protein [Pseudobythopirellula maris]|uniref:hypothetical protein n=1 Tax=Pseudobythopirellula maris TaxID=2527991 RepID=UPI0011B36033|nr:hypothetical protein [Pseudobythopirellula maris]
MAILFLTAAQPAALLAGPPAERVFSDRTVGYLSVADVPDFRARWNRTQIGLFTADPAVEPFADQVREKLKSRFGDSESNLGASLDDIFAAASGEAAAGLVSRGGARAALTMMADCTDRRDEADALLEKIDARLKELGASREDSTVEGGEVRVYTIAATDTKPAREALIALVDDHIVASDIVDEGRAMLDRFAGGGTAPLTDSEIYQETRDRSRESARLLEPTVSWFLAPFGWDEASRTRRDTSVGGRDTMGLLREQGFDAIRGAGGVVAIASDARRDFVHHTSIYAPAADGLSGEKAADKYRLAMRMMELINVDDLAVEPWAPRQSANYRTVSLDIAGAFDHFGTLFDAMAGYEGAFTTTIDGFAKDPYGPKIKIREEIVSRLGERVTVLTDYALPVEPDSQRYLVVIEATDPEGLREPIDKLMKSDGAELKELDGVPYWEVAPDEEVSDAPLVDSGLLVLEAPTKKPAAAASRSTVCVHNDALIVASDAALLRVALQGVEERESLAWCPDLKAAFAELDKLAPNSRSSVNFTRLDEKFRPGYELIRQNRMPESKTFVGRFLNRLLTTEEEEETGAIRPQRVDGSSLPSFEMARRYFGPAAQAVRSDNDGWTVTGVVLSKAAE